MERVRAAGPEQNRTTGPPATAFREGRPRASPHPGRSSRPRNPDAHSPGLRGPQTNVPLSGEMREATMMRTKTGAPAPVQFACFVEADPGHLPQTPLCQVFGPSPVDQPEPFKISEIRSWSCPWSDPELTCVLRYHTARFVRLTLLCDVGSGPMRPRSAGATCRRAYRDSRM